MDGRLGPKMVDQLSCIYLGDRLWLHCGTARRVFFHGNRIVLLASRKSKTGLDQCTQISGRDEAVTGAISTWHPVLFLDPFCDCRAGSFVRGLGCSENFQLRLAQWR